MGIYTGRTKDGWPCSYDEDTHRVSDVMLATGDDIDYYNKHYKEWIGQLDPAYERTLKNNGNSQS